MGQGVGKSKIMRYYPLSQFLRGFFGCRVDKIPLDAGFTCPNRDGTISRRGCIYCWNPSFSPVAGGFHGSVAEQVRVGKQAVRRNGEKKYLAYFQAFTNTYAPVDKLREIYDQAVADPEVVGMCVATRPDCVPDQVLDLLEEYAGNRHVWLELGLQSSHDRTLCLINRGHRRSHFEDAVARCQGRGIYICAHVILGLPAESHQEMLDTADFLSAQPINGVKIHHLQVIEQTPLADRYRRGRLSTLSFEEYLPLVCDFLEHLRPDLTIHRLIGESLESDYLLAPRWHRNKTEVLEAIENELNGRGTCQGSRWRQH
jgi:radical SAM protein (TIGR01212 family)